MPTCRIAGTLGAPIFNGELKVSHGEVDAYQINMALRELNLDARLKDTQLQLKGDGPGRRRRPCADQRLGRLAQQSALRLAAPDRENLRVVNIPKHACRPQPDVTMKLNGHRIDVTGTVTLPYARLLRPDTLANATRASSDEIIVSANQAPPAETFHVFSDLTLKLGERVTIDTLGLVGRLSGSLRTVADDYRLQSRHRRAAGRGRQVHGLRLASSTSSAEGCSSRTDRSMIRSSTCARSSHFPTSPPASTCAARCASRV